MIVQVPSMQPFFQSEDCEQFCYRYEEDCFHGFSIAVFTAIDQITQTLHLSSSEEFEQSGQWQSRQLWRTHESDLFLRIG